MRKQHSYGGKLTALLLAAVLTLGLVPIRASAAGTAHFKDVPSTHWAYSYVERAYSDRAISGTGGDPAKGTGVFDPDAKMTYSQFLTMLMSAFYPEEMARVTVRTPWYAPAIQVASSRQLTYISQDDLMNKYADASINRYNMSWILVKLLEDKGVALPTENERAAAAAKIADWDKVGTDHKSWPYYVSAVVAAGLISGVDDRGTFDGAGYITRGAAAVIYTKLADKLSQPGTTTPPSTASKFSITKGEGWELIPDPAYWNEVEETFNTVYPRLWARWGGDVAQKEITVNVKKILPLSGDRKEAPMWTGSTNYDHQKQLWERNIEISANFKDVAPTPCFAHELGHVVQIYSGLDSSWWIETLASYASFRYCFYADDGVLARGALRYIGDDQGLRNWRFENDYYTAYWFFAYMDSRYPTTPQGYGLIDSIHFAMASKQITSDNINDPNLNAVVKRVTGLSSIEQVRQQYVKELDAGTWAFNGFGGYADNYITENIPGVPNPTYPTVDGLSLCAGAYTYAVSGQASSGTAANNLVDGNLSTKWQAAQSDATNRDHMSRDAQHDLCISLSKPVVFDTYVLYHAGSQGEDSQQNTVSWRLKYYDSEKKQWKTLDTVSGNTQDVTTRKVISVTTKNLWLEILDPSGTGDGTVRLYELELYNKG